jgi:hypothetical protein
MRTPGTWLPTLALSLLSLPLTAQATPAPSPILPLVTPKATDGTFLLTVFLKHDQSRPLGKLNEQLKEQGFFKAFPPKGIEVVSWYVVMGIGQVVTLKVPTERLREVNRVLEDTAWGAYTTEFYASYDFKAVAEQMRAQAAGK